VSKGDNSKQVLVLDDEPEYVQWIREYLEAKRLSVTFARTLREALQAIATKDYRLLLVDMNVPSDPDLPGDLRVRTPLIDKYPGLALAIQARNMGYGAHSVIAYTVHDDDAIDVELGKLNCRYVLKGRPQALKRVVDSSLTKPTRK
jgi:CheY-like chemotaxis protein